MTRSIRSTMLVAVVFGVTACSGGDDSDSTALQSTVSATSDEATVTSAGPETTPTTVAATTVATTTTTLPAVTSPLADRGVAALTLISPTTGIGERPTFTWQGVDGVDVYVVSVTGTDGTPLWAWRGITTEVALGGGLIDGEEGPRLAGDATIDIFAVDGTGRIIAASGPVPISA
jgi:hypothetical protein